MEISSDTVPVRDLELLTRRLEAVRWVAAALCIPLSWIAWGWFVLFLNMSGMVVVAGLLALTNLALISHRQRRLTGILDPRVKAIRLRMALWVQLAVDAVAMSMAFLYLGGIESAFAFLSVFHVAAVAAVLGPKGALRVAAMMFTGLGTVMMLEFNRAVYHFHLMNDWRWGVQKDWRYLSVYGGLLLASWILACFIPWRRRSS